MFQQSKLGKNSRGLCGQCLCRGQAWAWTPRLGWAETEREQRFTVLAQEDVSARRQRAGPVVGGDDVDAGIPIRMNAGQSLLKLRN
ncbi:hypothetical protein [Derxia lacustris]|uniref:hypothetical protein n=1 Tax=Derxia lacustris TaxID=764842 RepID=UPI00111C545E|nr:hypothetical protein [Derxia lacustris]